MSTDNLGNISIHAPLRGATGFRPDGQIFYIISIHAPLRGATLMSLIIMVDTLISIHAPLRGATRLDMVKYNQGKDFYPRTPAGCDYKHICNGLGGLISIHAPLRGATKNRLRK